MGKNGGGFEYKGNWAATTLYKVDDIVTLVVQHTDV